MLYNKKVYKIKTEQDNIRTVDIFLIEEQLPNYIEWRDDLMEEGARFTIGVGFMGKEVWDATSLHKGG